MRNVPTWPRWRRACPAAGEWWRARPRTNRIAANVLACAPGPGHHVGARRGDASGRPDATPFAMVTMSAAGRSARCEHAAGPSMPACTSSTMRSMPCLRVRACSRSWNCRAARGSHLAWNGLDHGSPPPRRRHEVDEHLVLQEPRHSAPQVSASARRHGSSRRRRVEHAGRGRPDALPLTAFSP